MKKSEINYDRERQFHDEWASDIDYREVKVLETFTGSTSPEARWIVRELGDLSGKRVLELGSGAGEGAVFFALKGAKVTATDLSPAMLEVVKQVAAYHKVEVDTQISSAEDLSSFADQSFDVVYAANLLHHVDIAACLDEVNRVLKPGGMAAFWDPVAHNPVINVYRAMAADVRTEDEHPIRRRDLKLFTERFSAVKNKFFWLTTLAIFLKFYLIDRINPNEDRYWKRILNKERELRKFYLPLEMLDRVILTVLPIFKWWCWNIAVMVRK